MEILPLVTRKVWYTHTHKHTHYFGFCEFTTVKTIHARERSTIFVKWSNKININIDNDVQKAQELKIKVNPLAFMVTTMTMMMMVKEM